MRHSLALILAILIASIGAAISAEIKEYVPTVKPVYSSGTLAFLDKLGDSMKRDGYLEAAAIIKSYATGVFGSGFVYATKEGADYIVTNRHVVSRRRR
jgi:S1-C subfamily serine protease